MNDIVAIKVKLKEILQSDITSTINECKKLVISSSPKFNELTLINGRKRHIQKQFNSTLISDDTFFIQMNKVRNSIIDFIDELNTEDIDKDFLSHAIGELSTGILPLHIDMEITIDEEFENYTEEKQKQFVQTIQNFFKVSNGELKIRKKSKGSVKLTVRTTINLAERLVKNLDNQSLKNLKIIDVEIDKSKLYRSFPLNEITELKFNAKEDNKYIESISRALNIQPLYQTENTVVISLPNKIENRKFISEIALSSLVEGEKQLLRENLSYAKRYLENGVYIINTLLKKGIHNIPNQQRIFMLNNYVNAMILLNQMGKEFEYEEILFGERLLNEALYHEKDEINKGFIYDTLGSILLLKGKVMANKGVLRNAHYYFEKALVIFKKINRNDLFERTTQLKDSVEKWIK